MMHGRNFEATAGVFTGASHADACSRRAAKRRGRRRSISICSDCRPGCPILCFSFLPGRLAATASNKWSRHQSGGRGLTRRAGAEQGAPRPPINRLQSVLRCNHHSHVQQLQQPATTATEPDPAGAGEKVAVARIGIAMQCNAAAAAMQRPQPTDRHCGGLDLTGGGGPSRWWVAAAC